MTGLSAKSLCTVTHFILHFILGIGNNNSHICIFIPGSSSAFNVSFTYIVNSNFDYGLLDIYSNNAYLNQIALSHSIDDIRFVAIDGDVKYMESFELHMSPS